MLTIFTHGLIIINQKDIQAAIAEYLSCESTGLPHSNDSTCSQTAQSVKKVLNPIPTDIAIIILGFLPVVNLVYVIQFSELKSKIKTYSQIRYMQYIPRERKGAGRKSPYALDVNYDHKTSTLLHGSRTDTEILITPQGTLNRDHSYY